MAVRVEGENIAECLDGHNRAWNEILLRDDILEENVQGFPGTAAQFMQKTAITEKVPAGSSGC